jgi:hypothetical protein
LVEAMDSDIAERGLTRRGGVRSMIKLRLQASRRGGLAEEIARRRSLDAESVHDGS